MAEARDGTLAAGKSGSVSSALHSDPQAGQAGDGVGSSGAFVMHSYKVLDNLEELVPEARSVFAFSARSISATRIISLLGFTLQLQPPPP